MKAWSSHTRLSAILEMCVVGVRLFASSHQHTQRAGRYKRSYRCIKFHGIGFRKKEGGKEISMNVESLVIWRSPVFSVPDTWRRGITLCLSQQRGFSERWNCDWSLRKGDRCAAPRASSQGHREVIDQRMMAVINVTPFPATAVPYPPDTTTPPSCRHKTEYFFFSLSLSARWIYL